MQFKGKNIDPYESFYWDVTDRFNISYGRAGLSPCLNCCEGGGLEPKIIEEPENVGYLEFSNFISLGTQNNSYNRVWKTDNYCGALNCTKQMEILDKQKMQYRIRKLTPRECFRLMDVDDADIDKIQAAGISNSQQYKLAGTVSLSMCFTTYSAKCLSRPRMKVSN